MSLRIRSLACCLSLCAIVQGRPTLAGVATSAPAMCDPAAVFARVRAVAGGAHWNGIAEIAASGSVTVSGLHGTAQLNDDLVRGRFARRFRVAVQGASGEVYDGTTLWYQDISGGVHPLDSTFPRQRATTDAYLARRGYFDPSADTTMTCRGDRVERGRRLTVIRVHPRHGIPADVAIDAKTSLLATVSEVLPLTTQVTHYADYRRVNGLMLPFRIASGTTLEPEDGYAVKVRRYTLRRSAVASDFRRPAFLNGAIMLRNRTSITVPITLEAQQLLVWASIDGHAPMPFVLDTGGHAILTTVAARALGLHGSGAGASGGSGPGTTALQYTAVKSVRIGDAMLRNQPFLIIPYGYSFYERGRKTPLAGIIGLEFFERFATRIDYAHRRLTLTPLTAFRYRGNGVPVAFRFQDDMPMVNAAADGYPGLFGTDTGNSGSLILFGGYLAKNDFARRYPGGVAILGHGTGGTNTGRLLTLRRFTLGGTDLRNVPSTFTHMRSGSFASWTEAGNIGYDVLSRFIPTYDYARETLYLEPSPSAPPLMKSRAGVSVDKNEPGAFEVSIVRPGMPAAAAGMKPGDRITRVNGRAAADLSRADFVVLASLPRTNLRLRVARGASARDVTLVLH